MSLKSTTPRGYKARIQQLSRREKTIAFFSGTWVILVHREILRLLQALWTLLQTVVILALSAAVVIGLCHLALHPEKIRKGMRAAVQEIKNPL